MAVLSFIHLASFGILLGSQIFQTCINGITAFKALHRHYFGVHQAAIFPVYFSLQTFLPLFVTLTSSSRDSMLKLSAISSLSSSQSHGGWPMAITSLCGLINLLIFRPVTQNVVRAKKAQELRDGKKSYDAAPHSPEMMALNKQFLVVHATSIAINVSGVFATISYGIELSERLP